MTQEAFIKILDKKRYSYEIEGDKIIVTYKEVVDLSSYTSLPPGVVFNNRRDVWLDSLTSFPSGVEFRNGGHVNLNSLNSLPPGVEFKNGGDVYLGSLTSLPPGVESLTGFWFSGWKGIIKGIDPKRLLNVMIKQGVFER